MYLDIQCPVSREEGRCHRLAVRIFKLEFKLDRMTVTCIILY